MDKLVQIPFIITYTTTDNSQPKTFKRYVKYPSDTRDLKIEGNEVFICDMIWDSIAGELEKSKSLANSVDCEVSWNNEKTWQTVSQDIIYLKHSH